MEHGELVKSRLIRLERRGPRWLPALLVTLPVLIVVLLSGSQRLPMAMTAHHDASDSPPPAIRARCDKLLRQLRGGNDVGTPLLTFTRTLFRTRTGVQRESWVADCQPPGSFTTSIIVDAATGEVLTFASGTDEGGIANASHFAIRTPENAITLARRYLFRLGKPDASEFVAEHSAPLSPSGGTWYVRARRGERGIRIAIMAKSEQLTDFREGEPYRASWSEARQRP